jgi:hypothetical protein
MKMRMEDPTMRKRRTYHEGEIQTQGKVKGMRTKGDEDEGG